MTTNYGYDAIYQLLSATQGVSTTESYTYDRSETALPRSELRTTRKRPGLAVWTDYVELTKMGQVGTYGCVHLGDKWTLWGEQLLRECQSVGGVRWRRSGGSSRRR